MKKITKTYLALNYIAIILLIIVYASDFGYLFAVVILQGCDASDMPWIAGFVIFLLWCIPWMSIVPFFLGNLAKKVNYNPKTWFRRSLITTLLPFILFFICLIIVPEDLYLRNRETYHDTPIPGYNTYLWWLIISVFSSLLPIILFLTFSVLRYKHNFLSNYWKNLDQIDEPDTMEEENIEKHIDLSKIVICPHCKNPNTKKLRECEWCGNKIY